MDEWKSKDIVEVCKKNDKIVAVKIIHGKKILDVISAYALQVGIKESLKKKIWEDLNEMVRNTPMNENLYIGGDLNRYVGWLRKSSWKNGVDNDMKDLVLQIEIKAFVLLLCYFITA